MKIMHHVAGNWNLEQISHLSKYGIEVEEGISAIQIEEGEVYNSLKSKFLNWEVVDIVHTIFTKGELNIANNLSLFVKNNIGYPQPESSFGYRKTTYDDRNYCEECGIGLLQINPFSIKKEPRLGKKKLFQLTWVDDEIFVEKAFYNDIIAPLGIESIPVLIHKTEKESETIVQLKLEETKEELDFNQPFVKCYNCQKIKYTATIRGMYPDYLEKNVQPMFKSLEYFGEGHNAFKKIIVTQEIRQLLVKHKAMKENEFVPMGITRKE